ncbi:protein translocase subunit SecDF [Flammeovirga sp. MY04]|uniref:protein translocase subunit SecDF n=1 Tax=Flammeovirga sp. MY04 TaxID=1191459 RepID=UPI000824AE77|nr:protein translocase subunit SecDF [Flammeovirga sp. MY04]ANQ47599.2 protein translocase subunit SecDF [Flammeovirga sp. MY04]
MRNKGFIMFIATLVTLLSIYNLSFTWMSNRVQSKAETHATNQNGIVDYQKKQAYLDSVWKEPVVDLGFVDFTYEEIKNKELTKGLDLQGGMHVTLEVSQKEIIEALASNNINDAFENALIQADRLTKENRKSFSQNFFQSLTDQDDILLASYFANSTNKDKITLSSNNSAVINYVNQEIDGAVESAFEIIRTRIDKFGVTQPNIQRIKGTNKITMELPGVNNPERVRNLVQGMAKLEFVEVWDLNDAFPHLQKIENEWVKHQKVTNKKVISGHPEKQLFIDEVEPITQNEENERPSSALMKTLSPYSLIYALSDTADVNKLLNNKNLMSIIPSNMKFAWGHKSFNKVEGIECIELFIIKKGHEAKITGDYIADAEQKYNQKNQAVVSMVMNNEGTKKWKKMTSENYGNRVAIVLDNEVYTAPTVQAVIDGGRSEISGDFDVEEAKDLANVLKAGKLPAPTHIIEEVVVGPSLGDIAQADGIQSVVIGLSLVLLFMTLYYAKGGWIANAALGLNILLIFGILAELGAVLTLPGIAGIVLTIGMSIDANVLIFERIREEQKKGSSFLESVSKGYNSAFRTILDANVTTLFTGFFLYTFGIGPIKGFAVTLIIGIICSFFTAVFVTRLIITYFIKKKGQQLQLNFETKLSRLFFNRVNFDFLKKRKMAYFISSIVIVAGLSSLAIKGLNKGVDFTGGRTYVVSFNDKVIPSALESSLSDFVDGKSLEVKTYGDDKTLKITTSYLIEDETTESDDQVKKAIIDGVESFTGQKYADEEDPTSDTFVIPSQSKVGASMADDISISAQKGVLFSLVSIFIYIWLRFRNASFGIGAVAALIHDTLIVFSIFGIANLLGFGFEMDQVFIAAVLTVIGYSINDTVVVFDRIREEDSKKQKTNSYYNRINTAINGTLNRTIITSITTLMVVLVLLIFGGDALRTFAFTLCVGVLAGTYSSIFIAAPIVFDISKKKIKKALATA